jgi:hypothetical protein
LYGASGAVGADEAEGVQGVVRQLAHVRRDGVQAVGRGTQRVAVGLGLRQPLQRDGARGAGDVFRDDLLAQRGSQPLGHQARGLVGGAAGGQGDDHLDRFVGPGLCAGALRNAQADGSDERRPLHGRSPSGVGCLSAAGRR